MGIGLLWCPIPEWTSYLGPLCFVLPGTPVVLLEGQSNLSSYLISALFPPPCVQIYDNAMIAAGLNDDPRPVVTRLNELLTRILEKH